MSIRDALRVRTRLRSVAYRIWPPRPQPLILMYHRIANEPVDHWRLAVSPAHFAEQLDVVRRTRHPLLLADFVHRLYAGTLPQDAIAVTFDDGYVDNLTAGKPCLAAAGVPATVFLATRYLDRPGEVYSDELARLVLLGDGPQVLELTIQDKVERFHLGQNFLDRKLGVKHFRPSKNRRLALDAIWEVLRHLEFGEREAAMADIRLKFDARNCGSRVSRAMTGDEVRALVEDGIVTIGAHTATHPVLPALEPADCQREIAESKEGCEALIGAPIEAFAYPYGRYDDKSRGAVRSAGFAYACSAQYGPASDKSDIFALPRIHVPNVNGDSFELLLRTAGARI